MIATLVLVLMGVLVLVVIGLTVFANRRINSLVGGPRREPDERKPDMIRSGLPWVPPRG
jgi:hypothetical protein